MSDKSIVGDLINFRGLVYAPLNENGVIFLFGKVADDLNMYIEEIKPGFPDCVGRRFVGKGWERVAIEFEYQSRNFQAHGHDPEQCDMIICWEHNWPGCPIEVVELRTVIPDLENYPTAKPGSTDNEQKDVSKAIEAICSNVGATAEVQSWYYKIFEAISKVDDSIWSKVGRKYIGWYCPERAFASVSIRKRSIRFEVFARGESLAGTKVLNARFAPRWATFSVTSEADVARAVEILTQAHKRIKDAMKAGEPTGAFSGGEGSAGAAPGDDDDASEDQKAQAAPDAKS